MFNPFARSKNDLPSMNRHGITAWAHDIIDELQRIGTLNSGDEKAADDIFRVYQKILQFYSWVCTRPRIHVTHAQRPIQQPWAQNDIFASAHKVWSDLEWELRLEKDGAFVDQMIEHLGCFWNVKNNLVNQARHTRGLPVLSSMQTMAEAANYARISSIDRANIIQTPVSRTIASGFHFHRPVAPASRDNPRNVTEAFPAGQNTRRGSSSDDNLRPSQTYSSEIPSIRQPKTGHLQLPKYSQSVQEPPNSAMPVALSVKGKHSPHLHPGACYQPPTARDKSSRNVVNMSGDKYNDGVEYSQISQVPVGLILPAPPTRNDRYPNRAQGFGDGSKRLTTSIPSVKPAFSGREKHGRDLPSSHDGQLAQSHSDITRTTAGNYSSDIRHPVNTLSNDVIVILDTPSPESTTTPIERLRPRDYRSHPSSLAISSEDKHEVERPFSVERPPVHSRDITRHSIYPINPAGPCNQRLVESAEVDKMRSESSDRRSTKQGSDGTGEKKQKRVTEVSDKKANATESDLSTPKEKKSTPINGDQRNMKVDCIGKDEKSLTSSVNLIQNYRMNDFQKANTKRPEPINTISANQIKKARISENSATSSPGYTSPYTNFLKQYQPSNLNSPKGSGIITNFAGDKGEENKAVGGGYIGEKTGNEKSVGEKTLEESTIGSMHMSQKSINEELVSEKFINEKVVNEDSTGDEITVEAPAMEDAMSKKTSRNKVASEKSLRNKPLSAKGKKSKSLYRPFSMRQS
ncbi:hypothetical protein ACHAQE_010139 [Botrytis cinerea]